MYIVLANTIAVNTNRAHSLDIVLNHCRFTVFASKAFPWGGLFQVVVAQEVVNTGSNLPSRTSSTVFFTIVAKLALRTSTPSS